ncbi:hypothetical protein JZ751_013351, partial [Albula glossodonta]
QDIQDMPVRCAVCTKCANGADTIWGVDDKLLYSKKDSSRDIKTCTKASLRDSFPCRHNGTIILPTNDSFVFYSFERHEEGLFPVVEHCPTLDLPSTVTPDPTRGCSKCPDVCVHRFYHRGFLLFFSSTLRRFTLQRIQDNAITTGSRSEHRCSYS